MKKSNKEEAQKEARLSKARLGEHGTVKVKMDAGDGRTVIAEVASARVDESLKDGVRSIVDAEGYTLETSDGKYKLKPKDIEAPVDQAEAGDDEQMR